jgi:hypothetical protein
MKRINKAYHNSNKLIPFDEFADQIQTLPRAELRPLYFQDTDQETRLPYYNESRFKAVVSADDEHTQYTAVTNQYKLVQHQDVMFQVLNTIQATGVDGNARIKAFGANCYMDMVFSNMSIDDPSGSVINLGYTARNTYDSTGAINLFPFAIRSICSNGMIFNMTPKLQLNIISIRHMGEIVSKVKLAMQNLITNTLQIEGVFVELVDQATKNIIEFRANELELTMAEFTGSRLSARKVIETSKMPITGDISQWEIYNALTQYASWNATNASNYQRMSQAAEKLLNNDNAKLLTAKEKAIQREETRIRESAEGKTQAPLLTT